MQKKSFKNSIVFSVVVLSILLLGSLSIIAQPGLKIPIVPPIVTDSFDFRIYTHEMDSLVSM